MNKIRQGDEVIVITGKDKGRRGSVTQVLGNGRVLVEGINMVKKHQRPNPQAGVAGGIVEKEMPMSISNVMLFNPATSKGDRVGIRVLDDGDGGTRKVRYFKSNGEVVDI
ncbi:MAG: 50S ribosomal protein L24 [Pseudomonadota bacterium]